MHAEVKHEMITSTTSYLTLRTKENILSKSRLCETFIENNIQKKIIPIYRANFSGSNGIKIWLMRQLWRVLCDTKRSKYGSAVKCGTAGKRKCGKVRYCGVKGVNLLLKNCNFCRYLVMVATCWAAMSFYNSLLNFYLMFTYCDQHGLSVQILFWLSSNNL